VWKPQPAAGRRFAGRRFVAEKPQAWAAALLWQAVMVEEPSVDEAVAWLRGLQPRYEAYHRVRFSPAAIQAAAAAAHR
jgi:ATP-dependent Clp protease ATP-binding subunit ClpA